MGDSLGGSGRDSPCQWARLSSPDMTTESFLRDGDQVQQRRAERRQRLADLEKVARGQFFTKGTHWLGAPIHAFIKEHLAGIHEFLDPFAGEGDLLAACAAEFGLKGRGLDISGGDWETNDSLRHIPETSGAFVVTNPPYLARNSARRKGLWPEVGQYLDERGRDDLYQVALDRCLEVADFVVAIIPETFLLSSYPKSRLALVMVVEEEMFEDTEAPVCVAAFGPSIEPTPRVFLGGEFVSTLPEILALRPRPVGRPEMRFNAPDGQIGLRAVDGVSPAEPIRFMRAEEFGYAPERLRHSSRHMTFINIPGLPAEQLDQVIRLANEFLVRFRCDTRNLGLSPFKGNNRNGQRRRRLDYTAARGFLELSLLDLTPSLF